LATFQQRDRVPDTRKSPTAELALIVVGMLGRAHDPVALHKRAAHAAASAASDAAIARAVAIAERGFSKEVVAPAL
jgi:hypothetical protein